LKYIPNLDVGRFVAAIAVASCHFFMSNGASHSVFLEEFSSMSVEYFFVLSGFVLAPKLIKI
jgi:peptidoglycan/LPS O-acetylase OafA/YrhL